MNSFATIHEAAQAEARKIVACRPRLRPGERRATVSPWGFDMDVVFEYSEAEPAVLWGDYPYPGSPSNCAVISVFVGGVDIFEMLVDSQHEHIESALLEEIES